MSGRVAALVTDRRARVPFALIGLALLLLSGTVVLQVETQPEPTPPREADRALEQTESATETALTTALTAATEQAATRPVTDPAETPYGEVLAEGDTFDRYLKALFYLEAQRRLDDAGQTVGEVQTDVTLPEIEDSEDFADAVDRVTLRPGSETDGVESGVIEAEISGVETVATSDGREIETETETVTVAVASPLYELHDRTQTYQQRLDADLTEPGFTQRFNARIYALGWARGYAQYSGLPVTEVISNRHIVPAANDAIYRTQKDVFGAADPELNNAIRRGWLCMAMHDAEGLYNDHADKGTNLSGTLCSASKWLFGNQATGDVPDSPGVMDLLGEAPGMDTTHTIGVNGTSLLPIRDLASGSGSTSIQGVIDRIYEVTVETDLHTETVREPVFRHDAPPKTINSYVVETEPQGVDVTVERITEPESDEEYRAVEGVVEIEHEETKRHLRETTDGQKTVVTTASGTERIAFEITVEEGELHPRARVDEYNGEDVPVTERYVYDSGPGIARAGTDRTVPLGADGGRFENYGDPGPRAIEGVFDLPKGTTRTAGRGHGERRGDRTRATVEEHVESTLASKWSNAESEADLEFNRRETVDVPHSSRKVLVATVLADLRQIRQQVSNITHTFKRKELVHDGSETGPYGELEEKVQERKERYLHRTEPFESIGQKAVYEARYAYFAALERYLGRIESAHGSAMDEIDNQLPDMGIANAIRYLQEGVTATPPEPVPLESSSLTENVTYEVSGSPTYLVTENVTSETVPAVDSGEQFAPMAARNKNYLKLPYDSVVNGLLGKIGNVLGVSNPDAELTFQTASEALVAGDKATDAANADPDHGNPKKLSRLNGELSSAVRSSIQEYSEAVGAQMTFHLYPEDVTAADSDTELVRSADDCESDSCVVVPRDCTRETCEMEADTEGDRASEEIQTAVTAAVDGYGGTVETADAIASGEIKPAIVRRVAAAVGEDSRPNAATGLDYQQWRAIVNSSAQQVVRDAAAEHAVTLSDTKTVEKLDTEIRQTLESVSKEIVAKRFDAAVNNNSFDIGNYDNWVAGTRTPVRVPAGMPVLPVPGHWFATVNAWNIDVEAEYARFEVSANVGTPATATGTTYVREDRTVKREVAGKNRRLGSVEPISVSGKSVLIVVVPPGGIGVGDRDDRDPECSPTWPVVGDVSEEAIHCDGEFSDSGTATTGSRRGR
ncbi:hypothetical protein GRX03_10175 [Halovenus sp. WSH3]|uniref:Uncharacterized protein n=1 Tax=Halovenus carboxidivorans TaxID=2692199 RepID=A0A6B0T1N8_9EURY|nr:hypothetical protein [Halovenus carboxidivorans]MXR51964.1 hypothetical protein [Halovenus carboxidivorans]